jgi:hypothetical protein
VTSAGDVALPAPLACPGAIYPLPGAGASTSSPRRRCACAAGGTGSHGRVCVTGLLAIPFQIGPCRLPILSWPFPVLSEIPSAAEPLIAYLDDVSRVASARLPGRKFTFPAGLELPAELDPIYCGAVFPCLARGRTFIVVIAVVIAVVSLSLSWLLRFCGFSA